MSVITTAELDTYTGKTLDAGRAAQVVGAVNQYIDNKTGRVWGETASGTEDHDLTPVVFLENQDVLTVDSVELGYPNETATTMDDEDYYFNGLGRLVLSNGRMRFAPRRDYVHVTYTYGNPTVPDDLKLAALSLAADLYAYAETEQVEVASESIGSYRLEYRNGKSTVTGGTYFSIIDRYRTRRV